jgi:hypothetical protein
MRTVSKEVKEEKEAKMASEAERAIVHEAVERMSVRETYQATG